MEDGGYYFTEDFYRSPKHLQVYKKFFLRQNNNDVMLDIRINIFYEWLKLIFRQK